MTVRRLILKLLRSQNRRLERVEDAQTSQTQLLQEIKRLLVQLSDEQRELRSRLLDTADRQGTRIAKLERDVKSLRLGRANGVG